MPRALLLVPWICDFAAYDFWSCPVGLLSLGALLRLGGWEVEFVDLTDRHHPALPKVLQERLFHTGKYYAEEIPKPEPIAWVPRRYKRYGLPMEIAEENLWKLPRPDVILVTSRMTYWYPGVRDAILLCRRLWPRIPVVLGGTYATLCPDHARVTTGADVVWRGEGEEGLPSLIEEVTGQQLVLPTERRPSLACLDTLPFPAWHLEQGRGDRDKPRLPLPVHLLRHRATFATMACKVAHASCG